MSRAPRVGGTVPKVRDFALERVDTQARSGMSRFAPTNATALTGDPEDTLTHLTRLTATALDVPVAYVALLDGDRFVLAGHESLDAAVAGKGDFAADRSLSAWVLEQRTPIFIGDPNELQSSVEREWLGNVAYAAMPLEMPDGELIGTLSVASRGHHEWTARDREMLVHLAASVALVLRIRETIYAMDAMSGLLARMTEPMRELSEHVQSLTTLVATDTDPRVRKFAALVAANVQAANALVREVPAITRTARARSLDKRTPVDVVELVRSSVASARAAAGSTDAHLDDPRAPTITADCDPLALQESLISLLISLMHYADRERQIHVRVASASEGVRIDIIKLGAALPAAELTRMVGRFGRRGTRAVNLLGLDGATVSIRSGMVSARTTDGRTAFRIRLSHPLASAA